MNLNFYPNSYNEPSFNNGYNPYMTVMGLDNGAGLKNLQQNAENNLKQIQQLQNNFNAQNTQNNDIQNKPYYLFCGNKNDWDEFLYLNYGITEQNIFDDYKLFLQAKQELLQEQGQNKIDTMKDKIRNKNNRAFSNVDSTIQSNIKPNNEPAKFEQFPANNRYNDSVVMGDSSKPDNRLLEPSKQQSKEVNKKK